jgi:hypothetical protein
MMAVLLAPCREGLGIGVVDFGAEQPGLLSIPGDAFAPRPVWRTTRALITAPRDRAVMKRLAWTEARWPRPKRERWPGPIAPLRETDPPARWAAASAWAMKGRARCALVERMRPGRMRNSSSPLIVPSSHIARSR